MVCEEIWETRGLVRIECPEHVYSRNAWFVKAATASVDSSARKSPRPHPRPNHPLRDFDFFFFVFDFFLSLARLRFFAAWPAFMYSEAILWPFDFFFGVFFAIFSDFFFFGFDDLSRFSFTVKSWLAMVLLFLDFGFALATDKEKTAVKKNTKANNQVKRIFLFMTTP